MSESAVKLLSQIAVSHKASFTGLVGNFPCAQKGATPRPASQCNSLTAREPPNIFKVSSGQVSSALSLLTLFSFCTHTQRNFGSFPVQIYLDAYFCPCLWTQSIAKEGTGPDVQMQEVVLQWVVPSVLWQKGDDMALSEKGSGCNLQYFSSPGVPMHPVCHPAWLHMEGWQNSHSVHVVARDLL